MSSALLAASTVAVVWFVIGFVTTIVMLVMGIALVRHGMLVGRAVGRMSDEITPITEEIQRLAPWPSARQGGGPRRR